MRNRWTQRILGVGLLFLFLLSVTAFGGTDRSYTGINSFSGYLPSEDYVTKELQKLEELGLGMVRMGINGEIGEQTKVGDTLDFSARDRVVELYRKNNIEMHAVISYMLYVDRGTSLEDWQQNFRYRVEQIVSHYKGKINYYILGNEPDIDPSQTPELVVGFQKIFYETIKKIDPSARVESSPTASPETAFLREMIRLGVADYCDVIGVHAYGGQIMDARFGMPWKYLAEFGIEKPVAISESGVTPNWAPAGVDKAEWRRRWIANFYVQAKRFGYDHVLYYTLQEGDSHNYEWALINGAINSTPKDPGYFEIKDHWNLNTLTNGDFEDRGADGEHGWLIPYDIDSAKSDGTVSFAFDEAVAHSQSGYVKMENGKTSEEEISVRQTVDSLVPGEVYHITAYTKGTGGGKAMLRALGYNTKNGDQETVASVSVSGEWQKLSLNFVPTDTWAVVDLTAKKATDPNALVLWDDVSIAPGEAEPSGEVSVTEGEYNVVFNEDPDPNDTRTKKQAENATDKSGVDVSFSDTGFTGTGFMDFKAGIGSWFEWDNVESDGGNTILTFRYASGFPNNRNAIIAVNGEIVAEVPFVCTQGFNIWNNMSVQVLLKPGKNTIRVIQSAEEDGVNIDKMELLLAKESPDFKKDSDVCVVLNGQKLLFSDASPTILADRTLVPMRKIFESLGATVNWEPATRTVTAQKGDKTVTLTVDSNIAKVNEKTVELEVPAMIIEDRTMVPLRFISEALEAKVDWDGETKTVFIVADFAPEAAKESTENAIIINAHEYQRATGDVLPEPNAFGGGQVRFFDDQDELFYELELPKSGKYRIRYHICTANEGAQAELYQNKKVVNRYFFKDVRGWENYATFDAGVSYLEGGKVSLSVRCVGNGFDFAWLSVSPVPDDTELTPIPENENTRPGEQDAENTVHIEAEHYLPKSDIDVLTKPVSGRMIVGYFNPPEVLEFEAVDIPADGEYRIEVAAATERDNAKAVVYVNGSKVGTVDILKEGIYTYRINVGQTVTLKKGSAKIKVACEGADFDFDWVRFAPI